METLRLLGDAAWKVLVVGLVLGAGLPALFAIGVRGLALGNGHESESGAVSKPNPLGNVLAVICFVIVIAAIALGILIIVSQGFHKEVSFDHIYPTLVDK